MAEWLKAHAWKACVRETVPWVRIPLSPPFLRHSSPQYPIVRNYRKATEEFRDFALKRLGLLPAGRRRSLTPPDLARLSLVDFSEYSIESSDTAEAGAKCDFRQRKVCLVNEPLGPLHAHGLGNLNRTRSEVLLK